MAETFAAILAEGGKKNSLGRANEVIDAVLADKSRLEELYETISNDDAWVRMRAVDAFEKICREHTDWVEPYIDRIQADFAANTQPSIQWHMAQIYAEVTLTEAQQAKAIAWLKQVLGSPEADWIVAANSMQTLAEFVRRGAAGKPDLIKALETQQKHKSKAVVRRADKLLAEFS